MTKEEREEAIELLEKEKAYMLGHGGDTQANALNMAIKALEQEHCEDLKDALYIAQTDRDKWVTRAKKLAKIIGIRDCDIDEYEQEPCKDCISREKAKQFLYERLDRFNNDELYDIFSRIIDDMYNDLPSVIPQPFINKPCVSSGVCEYDKNKILDRIRAEIEQLPTNTKTNWDGCCPDIDYPEIEYVDVTKKQLLYIIDKYRAKSEE